MTSAISPPLDTPVVRLSLLFEQVVSSYPGRIAVSFGSTTLTYSELNQRANLVANWMIRAGIGPEHRVGVCLKPGLEIIITLLAIQKAGAAYLPVNHEYPIARIERIIDDARPVLVISEPDLIRTLEQVAIQPVTLDQIFAELQAQGTSNPDITVTDQNTACLFYTSGTTGVPKGIPINYQGLAYYIQSAQQQFGISSGDTILTIAKYSFSISLFDLLTTITVGGRLNILPREEIMDFRSLTEALEKATIVHIGPNLLKGLVHYIKRNHTSYERFAGLRHVSSGGDFVPAELLENLKTVFPNAEIYIIYGCTEIACMGCYYPVSRNSVVEKSYIGKPFPGTETVLIDENGRPVPDNQAGEICFAGPGVMPGYLNRPELTERAFIRIDKREYFRTGDLGRIDHTGNIEYLGRTDFQIKIRGQRIELLEIESVLRQSPGVRDAVVTAAEIDGREKRLIAYVSGDDPDTFALAPVRSYLQTQLPDYMQPSGWIILEKMPLNENFKISRRALPPPTLGNLIVAGNYVAPRTEAEKTLAAIWEEVLNIPSVGIFDEFRSLGGDSLMAMYVCMLAAEKNITISPLDFATNPTIASLVEEKPGNATPSGQSALQMELSGDLATLPPFIVHFLTERGEQPRDRWNISRMLVAAKRLSAKSLEKALKHMGRQHDALRLTIFSENDVWKGIVLDTPDTTLAFETVMLAGLSAEERAAAIRNAAAVSQKNINLHHGPIAHMILLDSGENEPQELYFVVHHLMMDVISWKNFWFEFELACIAFKAGRTPSTPAPAVSFLSWTRTFEQLANSDATVRNVEKLLQQDWPAIEDIPRDFNNDWTTNTNSSAAVVTYTHSAAETQALLRIGSHGFDLESVLIGALALALSNWQRNKLVFFDRLVHGRNVSLPDWDLSRTIGCLVSYAPTLLHVDASLPADALIAHIAKQMESIEEPGTSLELFKYYGLDKGVLTRANRLPAARVMLNYRGNIDAVFDKSAMFSRAYHYANLDHDPDGLRRYPIAVAVDLIEKKLTVKWVFSTRLHRKETVEGLSDDFSRLLISIINRELS